MTAKRGKEIVLSHTKKSPNPFFINWPFSDSMSDARSVLDKELGNSGTEENSSNCEQNSSPSKKQRKRTKNKRLDGYETSQGTVSCYLTLTAYNGLKSPRKGNYI